MIFGKKKYISTIMSYPKKEINNKQIILFPKEAKKKHEKNQNILTWLYNKAEPFNEKEFLELCSTDKKKYKKISIVSMIYNEPKPSNEKTFLKLFPMDKGKNEFMLNYLASLYEIPQKKKEIYIPLQFWSSYLPNDDFKSTYPNYNAIIDDVLNCENITDIEEIFRLKEKVIDMQDYYYFKTRNFLVSKKRVYDNYINLLNVRIKELYPLYYQCEINFDENELINGYKKPHKINAIIEFDWYIKLKNIWENKTEMNFRKFLKKFENKTSNSSWYNMDLHGNSYGSYWKYPSESYEYKNASSLCYKENCQALFELPYPKKFILHTIRIGQNNYCESVAFSNYFCEWMKRKNEQMIQMEYNYDTEMFIIEI